MRPSARRRQTQRKHKKYLDDVIVHLYARNTPLQGIDVFLIIGGMSICVDKLISAWRLPPKAAMPLHGRGSSLEFRWIKRNGGSDIKAAEIE